jgi:hypothetical protein
VDASSTDGAGSDGSSPLEAGGDVGSRDATVSDSPVGDAPVDVAFDVPLDVTAATDAWDGTTALDATPDVALDVAVGETGAPCTSNVECSSRDFCFKAIGDCGGTGSCEPRPGTCSLIIDPICGCDGNSYSNRCLGEKNGVSEWHAGSCP